MATTAEIQIVVDQEGAVHAFQQIGNEVKKIEGPTRQLGGTSNAVFTQMRKQQEQARDAAQLLSRVIGAEVPRALEKVLARSQTIGPALSKAFNVAVVAAFAKAAFDAITQAVEYLEIALRSAKEQARLTAAAGSQAERDLVKQTEQAIRETRTRTRLLTASDLGKISVQLAADLQKIEEQRMTAEALGETRLADRLAEYKVLTEREAAIKRLDIIRTYEQSVSKEAIAARSAAALRERMPVAELPPAITELPKWMQEMADQLDKEWASEKEIRGRQMELAGELADAEQRAAIASLEPWQRAYAQIQGDAERATREIAARYGGLPEEADKAARLTTAVWAEAGLRMRDQIAGDLESAFDDITSGNIGKRFLENFKKMVFQMVATWMLGMQQMRATAGFSFSSILSTLFGIPVAGAGGVATGAATAGVAAAGGAAAGAVPAFSWAAENAYATSGALPLSTAAATQGTSLSMAGLPLSAGQGAGAGIGATLPAGAATVGAGGAALTGWPKSLGKYGLPALMMGLAGASMLGGGTGSRALGGAMLGASLGAIPFALGMPMSLLLGPLAIGLPVVGAVIGGLIALFSGLFGGPHKGDVARIQVMEPAQRQIKNILDEYNLFQATLDQAISQLEQLRSQGIERINQIGGNQRRGNTATLTRWVDEAENQMKTTEAERQRRLALQFGGAMFHTGGYVSPSLARQTVPAWAAAAPRYQSGGAVPAVLEPREFVMSAPAVERIGRGTLERMNAGGEAGGITIHINALDPKSFSAWLRDGGMREMIRELRRARAEGAF